MTLTNAYIAPEDRHKLATRAASASFSPLEEEWGAEIAGDVARPSIFTRDAEPLVVSPFYVPPAEFFHAEAVRLADLIRRSRFVWCALGVFLGAAMVSLFNAFVGYAP